MPYPLLDAALMNAGDALIQVRAELRSIAALGTAGVGRPAEDHKHASAFVYAEAALEAYTKRALEYAITEINSTGIAYSSLRLSLFSLAAAPELESLKTSSKLKSMSKRNKMFDMVASAAVCGLNPSILPLDGRTLRARHFDTVWEVFGFTGASVPTPRHRLALENVADNRNDVAHGDESPAVVAGRQAAQDSLRLIDQIEDVFIHLHEAVEDYLDRARYVR